LEKRDNCKDGLVTDLSQNLLLPLIGSACTILSTLLKIVPHACTILNTFLLLLLLLLLVHARGACTILNKLLLLSYYSATTTNSLQTSMCGLITEFILLFVRLDARFFRKPSIEPYRKQTNIRHQQSEEGTRPLED